MSDEVHDLNATAWLERHAPGFAALSAEERTLLMQFSLLWSLFEGEVLGAAANVDRIRSIAQRWNRLGGLNASTFAAEVDYFKERYFTENGFTDRFEHLHLERSGNPQVVRDALSGHDAVPVSIATALLIIVLRYRNNLFHGEKWAYQLRDQQQNFFHANAILMRAMELDRHIRKTTGT